MNPQNLPLNLGSIKSRFAWKFLRALARIGRQRPTTSSSSGSPREIFQRYHRIKTAADKSLAFAVGSRRAWSRAMLCRIRNRRGGALASRRRIKINKKFAMTKVDAKKKKNGSQEDGFAQAKELRRLVPGGEAMDLCRLLEEAAHYVKCLKSQVKVMRSIADFYST
uniref:Transcription factor IBH1-like n=1 Tax=Rhizophora mucronata TaxID=61149 RepID=A0A2P2M610_RHIMU